VYPGRFVAPGHTQLGSGTRRPGPARSRAAAKVTRGYPAAGWVQAARLSTRPEAPEERAGANAG
jgi:hypothetical protein